MLFFSTKHETGTVKVKSCLTDICDASLHQWNWSQTFCGLCSLGPFPHPGHSSLPALHCCQICCEGCGQVSMCDCVQLKLYCYFALCYIHSYCKDLSVRLTGKAVLNEWEEDADLTKQGRQTGDDVSHTGCGSVVNLIKGTWKKPDSSKEKL